MTVYQSPNEGPERDDLEEGQIWIETALGSRYRHRFSVVCIKFVPDREGADIVTEVLASYIEPQRQGTEILSDPNNLVQRLEFLEQLFDEKPVDMTNCDDYPGPDQ